MTDLINRIVALSGPIQDEAAYRRYLGTLTEQALSDRELDLKTDPSKGTARPVNFWRVKKVAD